MDYFQCPHCGQPVTSVDVPREIAASVFNSAKSPAKAAASRANAKLPRRRKAQPDNPVTPEPEAPALVGGERLNAALRKVGPEIKSVAEARAVIIKSLSATEAAAVARGLKPREGRDYSGAYVSQ